MRVTTTTTAIEITRRMRVTDMPTVDLPGGRTLVPDLVVLHFSPTPGAGDWEIVGPVKVCGHIARKDGAPGARRYNHSSYDWGANPHLVTLVNVLRPTGYAGHGLVSLNDFEVKP